VAQPVVQHELDPRRHEYVQVWDGNEIAPRQEYTADKPRVGIEECGLRFSECCIDRHVTPEARTCHSHPGTAEIVAAAICLALVAGISAFLRLEQRGVALSVIQIAPAHHGAIAEHHHDRDRKRPLIPDPNPVSESCKPPQCGLKKRNGHGSSQYAVSRQ
jgi:hypothetical protein